ncbi:MAG: hypothetical protein H0V29_13960 [Thermoleophilaceae bacterium]|nr:hypothetical protein [Thermoleophilaceae bacterium]
MAAEKTTRIDVGFQGGQVLQLRLKDAEYKSLRKALEAGKADGWHDVQTEDSDIAIDLAQVVYVRFETDRHRVGF